MSLLLFTGTSAAAGDLVDLAASLIGRPYAWGAEGPHAFDCSGLTQYVFGEFGIDLPRRAISQSKIGDAAGRRFQRGDLLFFSDGAGNSLVTHVGIYEGRGVMIDASRRHGRVRRDDLSEAFWVERLLFGKRITLETGVWEDTRNDRGRSDDPGSRPPRPSDIGRRVAVRAVEHLADLLLRRAGR